MNTVETKCFMCRLCAGGGCSNKKFGACVCECATVYLDDFMYTN